MKASPSQTSFNAGEWSSRLEGRSDLSKYTNACRRLRNFLPTVQGPAIKRSGARFVKEVKDSADITRLIPFEFGTTQAYIIEFGDLYCRVYMDNGGVLEATVAITGVAATTPIEITTGAAHGYSTGQQVYISGSAIAGINSGYFHIVSTGATTFTLNGTASLGAGGAAGTVARVYEFVTTYTSADLASLKHAQSADVLYIACPGFAPRKLSRTGHTSWTLDVIAFEWPPFAPENLDEDQYVVASAVEGAGINLWSPDGIFTASHVGGYFRLRENLEGFAPEWAPNIDFAPGPNHYQPFGVGAMPVGGRCWYDGHTYELMDKAGAPNTGGVAPVHTDGSATDGRWVWKYLHSGAGYAQITALVNANKVTATVIKRLPESTIFAPKAITVVANTTPIRITTGSNHLLETGDLVWIEDTLLAGINNQTFTVTRVTATTFDLDGTAAAGAFGAGGQAVRIRSTKSGVTALTSTVLVFPNLWSHGAWSAARGYPRCVTFYEDRLVWAGSDDDPQALWASRTGRYEDHEIIDADDSALLLVLNTQQVNQIEWLSSAKILTAGTTGGEFVISAAAEGALTPGNAMAQQHSFYGCRAGVAPVRAENVTLFVQRAGRKLIEYGFDFDNNSYLGSNLAVLAEHLTVGRIREMAWAQEPDRIVWVVMEDGTLVGLTYDRQQEVVGWHQHPLGGTAVAVKSVAVIPHPDGDRDQVWFIVSRTVNGATKQYVEYLEETWLQGSAIEDGFYVDSGLTYNAGPTASIVGLWHLLNTAVSVLADGVEVEGLSVSATTGTLTLPAAASKVHVGLAYDAELEPMLLEAGGADGTSGGKTKRITNVVLRLEDTGSGLTYGEAEDELAIDAGTLLTDDTEIRAWPDGYGKRTRLPIKHAGPTPCTLVAIFPQVHTEDR